MGSASWVDKDGNVLSVNREDGEQRSVVCLKLKAQPGFRSIGYLWKENEKVYFETHRTSKHIYKITRSWGFNACLLDSVLPRETVVRVIQTDAGKLFTSTVDRMLKSKDGHYQTYKNSGGYETQKFVPMNDFDITDFNGGIS